ncbi:MAG: NUDIX hydrolase, partial [Pseudomonadota bacterium]
PGGAVDSLDGQIDLAAPLAAPCPDRLMERTDGQSPDALAVAAIRELWEETGLILGHKTAWSAPDPTWDSFARAGFQPDARDLHYFFRAITPPGRPRRFDARFFLLQAEKLTGDLDDFSAASDELSHLQWVRLKDARALNLPFITSVVLAELDGLDAIGAPPSVPFFENTDEASLFHRLGRNA